MPRGIQFDTVTATTFVTEECCACGVLFAITDYLKKERLQDHRKFWCPNGHEQCYMAKTEAEKLRDELAGVRADLGAAYRERNAAQAAVKRLERRAKAGMCSECKRTFQNVARHMKNKHGA